MGTNALLVVRTTAEVTEKQVRTWAYDLASTFGREYFYIFRPDNEYGYEPSHCLEIGGSCYWEEHLVDVTPRYSGTLIVVNWPERYYGTGWSAQGNAPLILCVADWLERRIPQAEIWYGRSNGVAELFDADARERLWSHFCNVGHRPCLYDYYMDPRAPICEFCGGEEMAPRGLGKYHCPGCGYRITTDGEGDADGQVTMR